MCGQLLMGSSDPGSTGVTGKVVSVPPPLAANQQVVSSIAAKRLGLGIRHRYSSSKGTLTLIEMETGKRVNH